MLQQQLTFQAHAPLRNKIDVINTILNATIGGRRKLPGPIVKLPRVPFKAVFKNARIRCRRQCSNVVFQYLGQEKKRNELTNEQSHIYGGVLAHCLKYAITAEMF